MAKRLDAYKTGETFLDGGKIAYVVDWFPVNLAYPEGRQILAYRYEDNETIHTITLPASTVLA